jgi:hypothetical protein
MKFILSSYLLYILFWVYTGICWVINLIQFFNCDFASPYKDELIHGIGIFMFPIAGITVWF